MRFGKAQCGNAVLEMAGVVVDPAQRRWPFSVEALSAVFDFNRAPFFQSFAEVRVERSRIASSLRCSAWTVRCGGVICRSAER
jgi:hypothetical protein